MQDLTPGLADRDILAEMVRCALAAEHRCPKTLVHLRRQTIRDFLDKYWRNVCRDGCRFPDGAAERLANGVLNTLQGGFQELAAQIGRPLTDEDLIIVSSDAERCLASAETFFSDWAWIVDKIVWRGIERFYDVMCQQGFGKQQLPSVVPFVPFPSTDIVVAAARGNIGTALRGLKATQLKRLVYGTEDLYALSELKFRECALQAFDAVGLRRIFQLVPEARVLLQYLTFG
jgi:hypothetical protein